MSQRTELPDMLRIIFERHNVIKRPSVPPMDKLIEEIKGRGMAFELNVRGAGVCQAEITVKDGQSFTQVADSADLATALAFGEALTAVMPRQTGLFDEEPPTSGEPPAQDVEFRDLALTAENPLDTFAVAIAREYDLTPLQLVDLLVEQDHTVIWLADFGQIVDVTHQTIEEATLRRWVEAAAVTDPVLTLVELAIYRTIDAGDPMAPQSRDIAITALERKAQQFEVLRSEARQREIGNRDLGYDRHADYWAEAAERRSAQIARCQVRAAHLRAEIAAESSTPDVTADDPDDVPNGESDQAKIDSVVDQAGGYGKATLDDVADGLDQLAGTASPDVPDTGDSPAPATHIQMCAESLALTALELTDHLFECGYAVYLGPDNKLRRMDTDEIVEDETVSDWVGEAMKIEPALSGTVRDLYQIAERGTTPKTALGITLALDAYEIKARHYDNFATDASKLIDPAIDIGRTDMARYWGETVERFRARAQHSRKRAQELRDIDISNLGQE